MVGRKRKKFNVIVQSVQDNVTGSRTLIIIHGVDDKPIMILIDAGMYQGAPHVCEKNGKYDFNPENLDVIIITHSHLDHLGLLPDLCANGANCDVYMSRDTQRIANKVLDNMTKGTNDSNPSHSRNIHKGWERAKSNLVIAGFNNWQVIKNKYHMPTACRFMLIENGHIPGSASVCLEIDPPKGERFRLFFSGDYKECSYFNDRAYEVPKEIRNYPISFFMMESTYGANSESEITKGKFEEDVVKYIQDGYSIVVTAFANSLMQKILLKLKEMQEKAHLPTDVIIYIDGGMGIELTYLWDYLESVEKYIMPKNVWLVNNNREDVINSNAQKIIVTTSGMCDYGPAKEYLLNLLESKRTVFYIPGYAADHTLAKRVIDTQPGHVITIEKKVLIKRAIVETSNEFSSHPRIEEIKRFVTKFPDIKFLAFNHGSSENRAAAVNAALKWPNVERVGEIDGRTAFQIGENGLENAFSIE